MKWLLNSLIFSSSLCFTITTLNSAEHRTYEYDELLSQDLYLLINNENFVIPKERFLLKEGSVNDVYNRYSLRDISSYAEARDLIDLAESGDAIAQFELYLNYKDRGNNFLKYNKDEAKKWLIASDESRYYWAQIENFNIYGTSLKAARAGTRGTGDIFDDEMRGAYHYMMYTFKRPYEEGGDRVDNVKDNNGRECLSARDYIPEELIDQYSYNKKGDYVFAFDTDLKVREDRNYFTSGDRLFRSTSTYSYPLKTKTERIYLAGDFSISKLQKDRFFLDNVIRIGRRKHLIAAAKHSPRHYAYALAKSLLDGTKSTAHNEFAIEKFKSGAIAGDPRCVLALGMIYHVDVFTERDLEAAYLYYMQYLCMSPAIVRWGNQCQSILNKWNGGYSSAISLTDFDRYLKAGPVAKDGLNIRADYLFDLIRNSKKKYYGKGASRPALVVNLIDIKHPIDVVLVDNEGSSFFCSMYEGIKGDSDNINKSAVINSASEALKAVGFSEVNRCYAKVIQLIDREVSFIVGRIEEEREARRASIASERERERERERIEARFERIEREKILREEQRALRERLQGEELARRKELRDLVFFIGSKVIAPIIVVLFFARRWYYSRKRLLQTFDIPKEFFFKAEEEFNSGSRNKDAYIKAEVLADGDESLTRLKYIEARASELYQDGKRRVK